ISFFGAVAGERSRATRLRCRANGRVLSLRTRPALPAWRSSRDGSRRVGEVVRSSPISAYREASKNADLPRNILLTGIVSRACSHHQTLVGPRMGFHVDGTEAGHVSGSRGAVTDGVLVADVVGNGTADFIHLVECRWKEGNPPRAVGNGLERPL